MNEMNKVHKRSSASFLDVACIVSEITCAVVLALNASVRTSLIVPCIIVSSLLFVADIFHVWIIVKRKNKIHFEYDHKTIKTHADIGPLSAKYNIKTKSKWFWWALKLNADPEDWKLFVEYLKKEIDVRI